MQPYWEKYFEFINVKDAHNRKSCRDWNGTAVGLLDCDCTNPLEERLRKWGEPFLGKLKSGTLPKKTD